MPPSQRYGMKITTVDPTQGMVRGVLGGDAQERGVGVYTTPLAFRWPVVGESWQVEKINGTTYLVGPWPAATFQSVNPGDLILNSPTGVVHVLGNSTGATDFAMRAPARATLVTGTVVVSSTVVTAASNIMLTAQDNNTTGALRVSARTPGASFTITSSNNADHGVVAYQIF